MSTHKITAIRSGTHPSMGDWENEYLISFTYTPPGGDNWNEPAYGASVEFDRVISIDGTPAKDVAADQGAYAALTMSDITSWAEGWLEDNEAEAIAQAESDHERDREYAAKMRAELLREDNR